MAEEAIHAGSDSIFASFRKLQERPEIKHKIGQKERLASLEGGQAWKYVTEVIERYIKQLEAIPISATDTVESIGFRYLASRTTIEYLQDVRDLPKRAKKAMKKND